MRPPIIDQVRRTVSSEGTWNNPMCLFIRVMKPVEFRTYVRYNEYYCTEITIWFTKKYLLVYYTYNKQ